jgi:probable phosphoglycerate mutase
VLKTLYLCRHGQTQWNQQNLLQGQLDSPLTEQGKQQAQSLANKAKPWAIDAVVSSPLGRAKETAAIVAATLAKPHTLNDLLCERHFGHWQGQDAANLEAYQDFYHQRFQNLALRPPGDGESTAMVISRLRTGIQQLRQASQQNNLGKTILVVSHGDVLECLAHTFGHNRSIPNGGGLILTVKDKNQFQWDGWID